MGDRVSLSIVRMRKEKERKRDLREGERGIESERELERKRDPRSGSSAAHKSEKGFSKFVQM